MNTNFINTFTSFMVFFIFKKMYIGFLGGGVLGFFISTYVMYRKVQVYD